MLKNGAASVKGLVILLQVFGAFADAVNRQNIQRAQQRAGKPVGKGIAAGQGIDGLPEQGRQDDGVEEGVGVIGSNQQRTFFPERFRPVDLYLPAIKMNGPGGRYFKQLKKQVR